MRLVSPYGDFGGFTMSRYMYPSPVADRKRRDQISETNTCLISECVARSRDISPIPAVFTKNKKLKVDRSKA